MERIVERLVRRCKAAATTATDPTRCPDHRLAIVAQDATFTFAFGPAADSIVVDNVVSVAHIISSTATSAYKVVSSLDLSLGPRACAV